MREVALPMDDRGMADRLVSYADGLVAASFVGMSALAMALGEPDIRCSIAQVTRMVAVSNLVTGAVVTGLLVQLRRWEFDLRSPTPLSAKSAKYSRRLHFARIAVVWFCSLMSLLLILVSSLDRGCGV